MYRSAVDLQSVFNFSDYYTKARIIIVLRLYQNSKHFESAIRSLLDGDDNSTYRSRLNSEELIVYHSIRENGFYKDVASRIVLGDEIPEDQITSFLQTYTFVPMETLWHGYYHVYTTPIQPVTITQSALAAHNAGMQRNTGEEERSVTEGSAPLEEDQASAEQEESARSLLLLSRS